MLVLGFVWLFAVFDCDCGWGVVGGCVCLLCIWVCCGVVLVCGFWLVAYYDCLDGCLVIGSVLVLCVIWWL